MCVIVKRKEKHGPPTSGYNECRFAFIICPDLCTLSHICAIELAWSHHLHSKCIKRLNSAILFTFSIEAMHITHFAMDFLQSIKSNSKIYYSPVNLFHRSPPFLICWILSSLFILPGSGTITSQKVKKDKSTCLNLI